MERILRQAVKVLILLLLHSSGFGQSKTGLFDYEKVIQSVPRYLAEREEIENTKRLYQDTLKSLAKEYQQSLERSIPHNIKMDSSEMRSLQDTLNQTDRRFISRQISAQNQIANVQEGIERDLKEKVSKALEKFCSDHGIICMIEKDAVFFCEYCKDYTNDLIVYLRNATTR